MLDLAQVMYIIPYNAKEVKTYKANGFTHTDTEISL